MTRSKSGRRRVSGARAKRAPATRSSFWRWLLAVLGIVLGATASSGLALSGWSYWSRSDAKGYRGIVIESGASRRSISELLVRAGVVDSAWWTYLYLTTLGRFGEIEVGPHLLPLGMTPRQIAFCLARHVRRPEVAVTIPEGFDHLRVASRLEQAGICPAQGFIDAVRRRPLLDRLGIRGRDGEGYSFPATYRLRLNSNPDQIFERFVAETRNRLRKLSAKIGNQAFEDLEAARGWGEFEILTLASIVEKEAQRDEERATIASVFFNRLDDESFRPRRMLQSDPTAGYGCLVMREAIPSCRDYQHRILPAMLRDASNPYNSYRHSGLPPGPIASPGEASILAVLKPAQTDYLFFVATGAGRHRFSRNYDEHDATIRSGTP